MSEEGTEALNGMESETGGCGDADVMQISAPNVAALQATIDQQQRQIDNLTTQLKAVTTRLDLVENRVSSGPGSRGPVKAFAPKSAPPSSTRRQTMDPRALPSRIDSDKKAQPPTGLTKRFNKSRERLPTVKDEAGTYRMYLKGRPVVFRLPEDTPAPTPTDTLDAPAARLQLEWAHGYRGKDCRNNLHLLGSGEIVYFTAAVCIIHNLETNTQRFYTEHTDDVKCIAVHPDQETVASGQVAGHDRSTGSKAGRGVASKATSPEYQPHVRIWNSTSLQTLRQIGSGTFDRALASVSFSVSDGGKLICAVDEHNDHRMSVWDWNKGNRGTKLAEMKSSQDAVFQAEFNPSDSNSIVCCGKNQLSFWNLEGKNLIKQMALFGKIDKPKFVTCITFSPSGDVVYSGDSNGNILIWNKGSNKINKALPSSHDGVVFSLYISGDQLISAGGKDQLVKVWNLADYTLVSENKLPDAIGCARVALKQNESFIIGTTKNTIVRGENFEELQTVVEGHAGELWGLAEVGQSENKVVTCCYDNHIKVWDVDNRISTGNFELPEPLHSIAAHPTQPLVVVGARTPTFYLYNTELGELVSQGTCGDEQLECVEISPDGSRVAIGSRNNHIYLFHLSESGFAQTAVCKAHTSFVTQLDWSTDSRNLRSNSGDYEVLYWDAEAGKQITDGDMIRSLEFSTQNCVLSLDTVGMWPAGADGTDINGCSKNHAADLLASADDFGKINLLRFPCRVPKAQSHSYSGHSSHVTKVRFTKDDAHLISTGGKDSTVLQWKICAE